MKQGIRENLRRHASALAAVITVAVMTSPAASQEIYKIGVSTALTGPAASNYAAAIEGLNLYITKLNKAGGINGRSIDLIIQDDQGEPSKTAANTKKLLTQDGVSLLINASLSSTFAPMIAEARRAGVPLMFASSVCPKEVYPPAEKNLFCTTSYAAHYDSDASLDFIKELSGANTKVGLAAAAIPVSREEIAYAQSVAAKKGLNVVDEEVSSPLTADYAPYATKLQQASSDWVYSWAPWVTQIRTFEALRRLGWSGSYIAWAHPPAEAELTRLKDGKLYLIGTNALFADGLPIHSEIIAAAKEANSRYPGSEMAEGWIAGMVVEASLRSAGWPITTEKLLNAMSNLKVDTKGLRAGAIEWTKDNHFRTVQSYRVYRWNPDKGAIEMAKDWTGYPVN